MIYLKNLEDETYYNEYAQSLKNRRGDLSLLEEIKSSLQTRKKMIAEAEGKKAQQNKASEVIAQKKRIKKTHPQNSRKCRPSAKK